MDDYPIDLLEFEKAFQTEEQCRDYIKKLRYPNGEYVCPKCGCEKSWPVRKTFYECASCGHQGSVIAGTIFQDTHKPLTLWFRAMWYITSQKNGASALSIQRILGLKNYETAWTWLHKIRYAMVRPERDKLSGNVEIDEALFGGVKHGGKRGRGAENKLLVAVAVETIENKVGRIRLSILNDGSSESLHKFIVDSIETGSTVTTDGWSSYNGIENKGYRHIVMVSNSNDEPVLPHVHTVVSLIKRWILGTLQGSCSEKHMEYYLDEFVFRFNRRKSKARGLLFYRLLQNAVQLEPLTLCKLRGK
jgi:transposase-like protein